MIEINVKTLNIEKKSILMSFDIQVSRVLYLTNCPSDGALCPYKQEIFAETKERKTTAAKIYNTLKSLLNSDLVPNLYPQYFISLQLLIESKCHLELISSGKNSSFMDISLYPFFFLLFSVYKPQNYQLLICVESFIFL